jgi:hypothetical protein
MVCETRELDAETQNAGGGCTASTACWPALAWKDLNFDRPPFGIVRLWLSAAVIELNRGPAKHHENIQAVG